MIQISTQIRGSFWYKSDTNHILTFLTVFPRLKRQFWSTADTLTIQSTIVFTSYSLPRLTCSASSVWIKRKHLIVWYFMFCFPVRSLFLFPSLANPLFSTTSILTSKRQLPTLEPLWRFSLFNLFFLPFYSVHYIFVQSHIFNAFGYLTLVLFQYILLHFLLAQDFGSSNLLTHWLPHRLHVCMT